MLSQLNSAFVSLFQPSLRLLPSSVRVATYRRVEKSAKAAWLCSPNFFLCCAGSFCAALIFSAFFRAYVPTFLAPVVSFPIVIVVWFAIKASYFRSMVRVEVYSVLMESKGKRAI